MAFDRKILLCTSGVHSENLLKSRLINDSLRAHKAKKSAVCDSILISSSSFVNSWLVERLRALAALKNQKVPVDFFPATPAGPPPLVSSLIVKF